MKRIPKILNSPWAIIPEKLLEIQNIYLSHIRGGRLDIEAMESQLKRSEKEEGPYQIIEGVAILPIDGVLAKKINLLTEISGGTSMQLVERDFNAVVADPGIRAIILLIDSPGGTVDGTQELARTIYNARGTKPIISYAESLMGSAAYWIGSAADQIIMSGDTTQVGSIGAVVAHIDISKAEEAAGVKTTEIVAGKYKRIASSYAPLSDEGRETLQDMVDYLYSVFVNEVARNRGVSETQALNMGDGKIFLGQRAIDVGLADSISDFSSVIARLAHGKLQASAKLTPEVLALREKIQSDVSEALEKRRIFKPRFNSPIPAGSNEEPSSEEEARAKWSRDPSVRDEFRTFEVYWAFLRAEQSGAARIFRKPSKSILS